MSPTYDRLTTLPRNEQVFRRDATANLVMIKYARKVVDLENYFGLNGAALLS